MEHGHLVKHGEVLLLLVKRSGKEGKEVARDLGLAPSYLSTLYKSDSIREVRRRQIAQYFGVDASIFETGEGLPDMTKAEEHTGKYANVDPDVLEENRRLKEELERTINDLMREREISDDLRAALMEALKVAKNR